jgi:hypothetical protein
VTGPILVVGGRQVTFSLSALTFAIAATGRAPRPPSGRVAAPARTALDTVDRIRGTIGEYNFAGKYDDGEPQRFRNLGRSRCSSCC